MAEKDPLVSSWFGVEFQGQVVGAFRECTGLGSENEVVEYKASGPRGEFVIKKVPGRLKWNNITLKRGITDSMDMWQWRKLVEQGKIDEARKNGTITMYNQQGEPVARWNFINAWPSKLTGPSANANNNEVAIEELEITHEGYERVS
ncbi:phage tail protein [Thermogemmatispora tikiterensis]|uniref:Phage tail protein n=1 Tax=Thermogemmatispora tikiterensis TaxID=1825093 RepID=A0A328VIH8_9CHLR|nr:phage tail protein [Thermogemmatispora tikiterensis]RAQ97516.1 phage tail protein [Thermogemmatispora tikiterensis]